MSDRQRDAGETSPDDVAALQAKYPFHKRFVRQDVSVRVEVERQGESLTSSSVNISPSGICFELEEPLEMGFDMRTLLYLPRGKEVEILKLETRMVWQEPHGEGWRIGAAFLKFAPGDERRLRMWLLELSKDPGKK